MKRNSLLIASMLFAGAMFFNSCKTEDTTAPVITFKDGKNAITHSLNAAFTAPTVTAKDDEDGDLSSSVKTTGTETVNINKAGTYTITYTVTDAAGNIGTATLTVNVKNDVDAMTANYRVKIYAGGEGGELVSFNTSCDNNTQVTYYEEDVTASDIKNKVVGFSKFGNYLNNNTIEITVAGENIEITQKDSKGTGCTPTDRTFTGTGKITATGFYIDVTETVGTTSTTSTTDRYVYEKL